MKLSTHTLGELLSPFRQYFQKDSFTRKNVNERPPLRVIRVRTGDVGYLTVDGVEQSDGTIHLVDDRVTHAVRVNISQKPTMNNDVVNRDVSKIMHK